jgi:hypothetical protein
MSINETLHYQIESTADWRRMKAIEFPQDTRNLKAAELLERLAEEVDKLDGSDLEKRIDALWDRWRELDDDDGLKILEELNEDISSSLRSVGFHGCPSGTEFLESYCETLEELIKDHVNKDDDGIEPPSVIEQVENDEIVKAAKRAYDEARTKAYAEARKRL